MSALPAPRVGAVLPPFELPNRSAARPGPLPRCPPSAGTRAAWARIIVYWVTNGSGLFQGQRSSYSVGLSGRRGSPRRQKEPRAAEGEEEV